MERQDPNLNMSCAPMTDVPGQVVDNFSSKLGLPRALETVESIDADHQQMARCKSRSDSQYRAILSVLKMFLLASAPTRDGLMSQVSGPPFGKVAEVDSPVAG